MLPIAGGDSKLPVLRSSLELGSLSCSVLDSTSSSLLWSSWILESAAPESCSLELIAESFVFPADCPPSWRLWMPGFFCSMHDF